MSAYPIPTPQNPPSVMTRLPDGQLSLAQQLQMAQAQQAQGVQPQPGPMPSVGMPSLPPPTQPNVVDPSSPQGRMQRDSGELQRLQTSGTGIDQITHPVDPTTGLPTTQQPSLLRRFGGVMAKIGNVGADLALGRGAGIIPGTDLHHQMLMNNQQGLVNSDLGDQEKQAQTTLLNAEPELKQQAGEIAQLRAMGYLQHVNDQATNWSNEDVQRLAASGYKPGPSGVPVPMSYQELSPTLQAVEDLKQSQSELADANTAYTTAKKNNLPLQMQMAAQRIATAEGNLRLAGSKLGLRQQEDNANFLGIFNGQPIGTTDANGNPQGLRVATANAPTSMRLKQSDLAHNVISNAADINAVIDNRPDLFGKLQGRATTVQQMIGSNDPDIASLGVMFHNIALASNGAHGLRSQEAVTQTENDLLNHFRNGPVATKAALGAMTGSMQTFIDAANQGKKPLPNVGSGAAPGQYKMTATGPNGKIGSNDGGQTWLDVKTGKAVQ